MTKEQARKLHCTVERRWRSKTEYSLTGLGKSLVPIVKAMDRWGEAWFRRMGLPVPCDDE